MARKPSSRPPAASKILKSGPISKRSESAAARSGKNPRSASKRSPLTSIVSAIKANLARRKAAQPAATESARPRQQPASAPAPRPPSIRRVEPVPRTSVVKKPEKRPTIRARKSTKSLAPPLESSERRKRVRPANDRRRRRRIPTGRVVFPGVKEAAPAPSAMMSEVAGPTIKPVVEAQFSIPSGYGDHRVVLMVKDPWWLYAYWEIQPATDRAARSQLSPQEVIGLQSILRVYDVTGVDYPSQSAIRSFDIPLSGLATNWYVHSNAPNRSFMVEVGLLTTSGRYVMLVRSNRVTTPRFGPSDVIDPNWTLGDQAYWKLFGSSAGIGVGGSPTAWARQAQELFDNWPSAALLPPARQAGLRGFWCRVSTDLVIHGVTEPRSVVRVQGQLVPVRKDGTFSFRFTMPEGTQSVSIEAISPDGRHIRRMTPVMTFGWAGPLDASEAATPGTSSQKIQPLQHGTGQTHER